MPGVGAALVADVGGTNARFAIAEGPDADGSYRLDQVRKVRAADFPELDDAVAAYVHDVIGSGETLKQGCIAVAAPIASDDEPVQFTNSPWRLDPAGLTAALGMDTLHMVNDFAAMARGAVMARPEEREVVVTGDPLEGAPQVVLGPGTGLGVGLVVMAEGRPHVIPTEGGHIAFAPRTEEEDAVLTLMRARHGHVSCEHLISGPGLAALYGCLQALDGASGPAISPADITRAALADPVEDTIARRTVEMFCAMLGGFASDAMVITGALGGVCLAGGVSARIAPLLATSDFATRFYDKGVMSDYVRRARVTLITSDAVALRGAAALLREDNGR